ncbi:MAG: peptidoglycan DD-metalloendopeptidase family protein [Firmicutes bacterium]|nr:peptidoglycan DD-metalloendopeptidase family protein [Bacillota bacterium]
MQGKLLKILVSLLLGAALALGSLLPGWASELEDRKRELNEVNRMIEVRKQQIQENKRRQRNVLEELDRLDRDIDRVEQELQALNGQIAALERAIDAARQELQKAEKDLEERTAILHQRLRDIYTEGQVSYLEVLLQATSLGDFLTRFDLMQRIAEQDIKLMKELAAERDRIEQRKKDLEARQERLTLLREQTRVKQSYLTARSEEKKGVLKQLESEREAYERALDELEATSRRLAQIIQQLQAKKPSPRRGTGRFIWPVPGYSTVTSGYGMRFHPILHQSRMHTGIDIAAPTGAAVVASDDGTVIYTGWLGGYGQVVVIDHGGGYSTLYAHLSRIVAGNGSQVRQGETIGYVGSTGWSTGPHLHFEVRVNGEPQNPSGYL